MGAKICQFGVVHYRCRCVCPDKAIQCDVPDQHGRQVTIERNPKPFVTRRFADGDQVAVTIVGTWRTEKGEHCDTEWMEGPFGRPLFTEGRAYMDAEEFELRDGSPTPHAKRAKEWSGQERAALSAAQDEIEHRISECESHRVLVDAVRAERDAETAWEQLTQGTHSWSARESEAFLRLSAARHHRRAVVDSIGGA